MKNTALYIVAATAAIFLTFYIGGGKSSAIAAKRKVEVVGEFRSKNFPISDHEHLVVFDVPNRTFPNRCWTYVNERTNTSNMHCDALDDSGAIPAMGPELER